MAGSVSWHTSNSWLLWFLIGLSNSTRGAGNTNYPHPGTIPRTSPAMFPQAQAVLDRNWGPTFMREKTMEKSFHTFTGNNHTELEYPSNLCNSASAGINREAFRMLCWNTRVALGGYLYTWCLAPGCQVTVEYPVTQIQHSTHVVIKYLQCSMFCIYFVCIASFMNWICWTIVYVELF